MHMFAKATLLVSPTVFICARKSILLRPPPSNGLLQEYDPVTSLSNRIGHVRQELLFVSCFIVYSAVSVVTSQSRQTAEQQMTNQVS